MPKYMYIVIGIITGNIILLLLTFVLVLWMAITELDIPIDNSGRVCVFYQAEIYCIQPERLLTNGE